mgnify:CR=1 FL=1
MAEDAPPYWPPGPVREGVESGLLERLHAAKTPAHSSKKRAERAGRRRVVKSIVAWSDVLTE